MGAVFALFGGFYYWAPKIIGKTYNDLLGKIHFWSMFIGVNITFFPQHFLGLAGMPRRIPDYPDSFAGWNTISSFGSIVSVVATGLFVYIVYNLFTNGKEVNSNPWQVPSYFTSLDQFKQTSNYSNSLEWVIGTPSPFHAFNDLPVQTESN